MTAKTITVTEQAYNAFKGMKKENESFSEAIMRIRGKRSLREFIGILSSEKADELEKSIVKLREKQTKEYKARMDRITRELSGN